MVWLACAFLTISLALTFVVCFFFLSNATSWALNLLTVLLQYSHAAPFLKIKGGSEIPDDLGAEGDVLSHLGRYFMSSLPCFFIVQLVRDN